MMSRSDNYRTNTQPSWPLNLLNEAWRFLVRGWHVVMCASPPVECRAISRDRSVEGMERRRGIALLTVLALLTVFGLILLGFSYTIRVEEQTVVNYMQTTQVTEAAGAGIGSGFARIEGDMISPQGKRVLGKKQPQYTSRSDPALRTGASGILSNDTTFDARTARYNPGIGSLRRGGGLPVAVPLGIDEDPAGDTTGRIGARGGITPDGAPGFAGVDDNLDGVVDNGDPADDDEDGDVDEDPLDVRRDGRFFPQGTGFDEDGDAQGVFDEAAKLNINLAGNNSGPDQDYSYGQGTTPFELDLAVFLYGRMVSQAEEIASRIVNYRQGDAQGGGNSYKPPGAEGDDDGDNDKEIIAVRPIDETFSNVQMQSSYQLHLVVGDENDNDQDGLVDEEDERYIGAPYEADGSPRHRIPSSGELNQNEILDQFRLGDRLDNDGDGLIDEPDEGVDEPDEFRPNAPLGDDHPFATLDEITMVAGAGPATLKKIQHFATVYSEADQVSLQLSTDDAEFLRLNPNLLSNWTPRDTEEVVSQFQYGPKLRVEDFFSFHVDNDGDWQAIGEGPGNGINERGDGETDSEPGDGINGIDDDGDGLIDEPSDDWDGNGFPSADFDKFLEPDVGAPFYVSNNFDDDGDGRTDEGNREQERGPFGLRLVGDKEGGRPRFESSRTELLGGIVQEGNGSDDDGDGIVDDTGDFNGDWMVAYDPEWHVNEDPEGDSNGDGYPGLGASVDSPESSDSGDIVKDRQATRLRSRSENDRLTSFADDDADGFADFRDPQVIAAMYAAEADLVDNDNDGEVDEPGERYIAAWDDDEDGRMDEDPPEFQFILNLADYVDAWAPAPITGDPDVQRVLGLSARDLVLADPPTVRIFDRGITSTRQRAYEMHPKFLSGPDRQQRALLENEMDLLLPVPPEMTNPVAYQGVEGIRINEALVKPVIRLEAEEVLNTLVPGPNGRLVSKPGGSFSVTDGQDDDGLYGVLGGITYSDTNWGDPGSIIIRPRGFQGTIHPVPPFSSPGIRGLYDALAPSIVFAVTNTSQPANSTEVGIDPEVATWRFENIPPGEYDIVLYLDPMDSLRGEVAYFINGQRVYMRSDFYYQDPASEDEEGRTVLQPILPVTDPRNSSPYTLNRFAWYTPKLPPEYVRALGNPNDPGSVSFQIRAAMAGLGTPVSPNAWASILQANPHFRLAQAYNYQYPGLATLVDPQTGQRVPAATSMLRLTYRLYPLNSFRRVTVGRDGELTITIAALNPTTGLYTTTFDRVELINLSAQYLELVNLTPDDVDLTGWTVNTPYGKYIIQSVGGQKPIIPRIKPLFENDEGRDEDLDDGIPLPGRPWDRAAYPRSRGGLAGQRRTQEDLRLDNNFMLLVHDRRGFLDWARENYPPIPPGVPVMELRRADDPTMDPAYNNDPLGPEKLTFKLVDRESDILTDNYQTKVITLTDPAGNEVDRFEYKTTFNNVVVDIPGNPVKLPTRQGEPELWEVNTLDVVALPGYRGMETFERGDPTQVVTEDRPDRNTMTKRFTPTLRLLAREAAIETFSVQPGQEETNPLTVTLYGGRRFSSNPGLVIPENPETPMDDRRYVGGWDFVGDAPDPGQSGSDPEGKPWGGVARSPEFGPNVFFEWYAGGLENYTNGLDPLDFAPTSRPFAGDLVRFTWTMGLRELIRAGFDPDVDDQLTVRVRGAPQIANLNQPGIVGEVLTHPAVVVVNPGKEREDGRYGTPEVKPNPLNPLGFDFFTKLRDGDTAFTIDLRERFQDLYDDLEGNSKDEPLIVIRLIMRKTTPDLTNTLLDNYYFYAIELCGRGRMAAGSGFDPRDNERMALIAGTPGRQNPGWVPAYPRRRRKIDAPTQRDEYDIVDNTPFVKNGLLANPGEISRITTGGRFETVNSPIIPQRLEEKSIYMRGFDSNAELAQRMIPGDESDPVRLILAQRERLDQYENQYVPLLGMITTSHQNLTQGLINVNTAIREVLAALPACPQVRDDPTELPRLDARFLFNSIVADFIIEGRNTLGRDQAYGVAEIDDDLSESEAIDDVVEFKLASVGRSVESLKVFSKTSRRKGFPSIVDILRDEQIGAKDVSGRRPDVERLYAASIVSRPDDGPYEDISRLLGEIVHMRRRERMAAAVRGSLDRTGDGVPDGAGDLRERLNAMLSLSGADTLTPRDMEEMMGRLSGLTTVRSRSFSVLTGGKALTADGGVAAARRYESVSRR